MFQTTEKKSLFKRFINKFFDPKITIGSIASFIATAVGIIAAVNPDFLPSLFHIGEKEPPKYEKTIRNNQDLEEIFNILHTSKAKEPFELDLKIVTLGIPDPIVTSKKSLYRWFADEQIGYQSNLEDPYQPDKKLFGLYDAEIDHNTNKSNHRFDYGCILTKKFSDYSDKITLNQYQEKQIANGFDDFPCQYKSAYYFPMESITTMEAGIRLKGRFSLDVDKSKDNKFYFHKINK